MSDKGITCTYCGATELWEDEMHDEEKCKVCFVNDCSHKEIIRNYEGSNHWRARWTIHCIKCNAFQEMRFYFPQTKGNNGYSMTLEPWDHEDIKQEDIYQ